MNKQKLLSVLCHLSIVFAPILLPLAIYIVYKNDSQLKSNALEALAFHLFVVALLFISTLLVVIVIGAIMWMIIPLWAIWLAIKAALSAKDGRVYNYPFTSQFVTKKK